MRIFGLTLAGIGALIFAYTRFVRPRMLRWGATEDEAHESLPGDELVPDPSIESTRAVTINASRENIWPWLVQMGYGRGGFYSYDWLENAFTRLLGMHAHYHSTDRIVPELQYLEEGDFIDASPPPKRLPKRVSRVVSPLAAMLGRPLPQRFAWRVARLDRPHAIVLEDWGAFVLEPIDGETTRLIARTRGRGSPTVNAVTWELPHFFMERRMLLGIKQRAETALESPERTVAAANRRFR
jgi:hypothetical protein